MCIYANAFVAGKEKESLILPSNPKGILATIDGLVNEVFTELFASKRGVFLTFHDGHCLCQFTDWKTFFEFAERIRQANDVDVLPVMIFGTGIEYPEQQPQEFDLLLDNAEKKPEHGMIIYIGISIRRRLTKYIGCVVSILYKSGKTVTGTLKEFNQEEDYGEISRGDETVFFNAAEIRPVDTIV